MTKPSNLGVRAEDVLAAAQQHVMLAAHHSVKANEAFDRYARLLGPGSKSKLTYLGGAKGGPKCLGEWTEWLAENGPAYRQDVQDGTGTKFTERATPYTIEWEDDMVTYADGHFPEDTIVRVRGLKQHDRGAPPTVYFLWSQRFEVYPEFGVGPVAPVDGPDTNTDTVLGVIHPPNWREADRKYVGPTDTFGEPRSDVTDGTVEEIEPRSDSPDGTEGQSQPRFASMDEWHERWDPLLEALSPHEVKPSDEEKEEMVATLPEGTADPLAVIAVEYNAARRRVQDRS